MFFGTGAFGLFRGPCVPPSSELGFSVLGYDARDADQATSINHSGGFFNHEPFGMPGCAMPSERFFTVFSGFSVFFGPLGCML